MAEVAGSLDIGSSGAGFVQKDIAGTYAFRFSGFTVAYNIVYRLAGLGQMRIDENGTIEGEQKSAITPLGGQKAQLNRSVYSLSGKIMLESGSAGSAKINFVKKEGDGVDVDGDFDIQIAGDPRRLWFLSSGSKLPDASNALADEHVELEAIRMNKP